MSAANSDKFEEMPKALSAKDRLEALLMAQLNDEKAQLCTADQAGLRTMFEMNSALLKRIAE